MLLVHVCNIGSSAGCDRRRKEFRRTVAPPGWLAAKICDYLAEHPRGTDNTAPLWPGRSAPVVAHVGKRRQTAHNWEEAVDMPTFCPARVPACTDRRRAARERISQAGTNKCAGPTGVPMVCLNDLRYTFVAQQIAHGESPWQGLVSR